MTFAEYVLTYCPVVLAAPHPGESVWRYFIPPGFADLYGKKRPGPFVVGHPTFASGPPLFWDDETGTWTTRERAAVYRNQSVAASVALVVGGFLQPVAGDA